jgi:hypothetical protein
MKIITLLIFYNRVYGQANIFFYADTHLQSTSYSHFRSEWSMWKLLIVHTSISLIF